MEVNTALLFHLLLLSLASGAAMGLLYDVLRIQRVLLGMNRYTAAARSPQFCPKFCSKKEKRKELSVWRVAKQAILIVQDLFFCLSVGVVVTVLLFYRNHGEFRGFVLVGALFGFLAYYFTVGKLVVFVSEYVVFAMKTAILYAVYYVTLPVITAARFLWRVWVKGIAKWRERRDERKIRRYHATAYKELLAMAGSGFLAVGAEEKTKSKNRV